MATLPVLISGSGLCGLLVARALATHSIPFIIYERDETSYKRAQGYRLRLSNEGLNAVQSILTPEDWKQFRSGVATTRGAGAQGINALTGEPDDFAPVKSGNEQKKDEDTAASFQKTGTALEPAAKGQPPTGEIFGASRAYIRSELLETVEDKIQWGKAAMSYTSSAEGVSIHFADGSQSPQGCLLIGADGIHSHIAKQVSGGALRVYDTQARMIHGQTSTTAFKALGEGVFGVSDVSRADGKSVRLVCNVRPGDMDDPDQTFGWSMVCSPGLIEAPGNKFQVVGKVAADMARELTAKWSDKIRPVLEQQIVDEAGFWKMTTSTPEGVPDWPNDPRVTVVGDAAHSMTPAGGNGANTALQSASILGKLLRLHKGWSPELTALYEKEMRPMASANVRESFGTAKARFGLGELKLEF